MNFRRLLKKSAAALALVLLVGFGFGANRVHSLAQANPESSTSPADNSMYHSAATSPDAMSSSGAPNPGSDQASLVSAEAGAIPLTDGSQPVDPNIMQNAVPQTPAVIDKPVSATRSLAIIVGSMVVASMAVVLLFYLVLSRKKLPTSKNAKSKLRKKSLKKSLKP